MHSNVPKRTAYYVLSSHWDREWYQDFQHYRLRLAHMLDDVLNGVQTKQLRGPFYADGQAAMLADYVAIRPQREQELRKAVADGHIVGGPWFVQPDEFCVSGEALIRNLEFGIAETESFGGTSSKVGFLCDQFGHISQLPQIMVSFGMTAAYVWRGVNMIGKRHFNWIGADGTAIPCYRFGQSGYWGYSVNVRANVKHSERADAQTVNKRLHTYLDVEADATQTDAILLFDGADHTAWDRDAYAGLALAMDAKGSYNVVHTSLDDHAKAFLANKDCIDEVRHGELREPRNCHEEVDNQAVLLGTLASRVDIKIANVRTQDALNRHTEPLMWMAHALTGTPTEDAALSLAWRYLLLNHAHDSICGCSIDDVHRDMHHRFNQAQSIGSALADDAVLHIARAIPAPHADATTLTLLNPLPTERSGVQEIVVHFRCPNGELPHQDADAGQARPIIGGLPQHGIRDPRLPFTLHRSDGSVIPCSITKIRPQRARAIPHPTKAVDRHLAHEFTLALDTTIPPCGWQQITVESTVSACAKGVDLVAGPGIL